MSGKKHNTALLALILIIICIIASLPVADAAPKIAHRPPMSVSAGTPLKINISISDSTKIESVVLNYRHMGENKNTSLTMEKVSGNNTAATYEATIDGDEVIAGYIFYNFNITDEDGYTISSTYTASVSEAEKTGGQLGIFVMAMVVAIIFIILEIGLKYRHI